MLGVLQFYLNLHYLYSLLREPVKVLFKLRNKLALKIKFLFLIKKKKLEIELEVTARSPDHMFFALKKLLVCQHL